jgi:hypothetical protein
MPTTLHIDPSHRIDALREAQEIRQSMVPAAIVIAVVAMLAIAAVWFATAYYSTIYKNSDMEDTGSNTDTNPPAANNAMNASPNSAGTGAANRSNPTTNNN